MNAEFNKIMQGAMKRGQKLNEKNTQVMRNKRVKSKKSEKMQVGTSDSERWTILYIQAQYLTGGMKGAES